ncbi:MULTISPECIES: hypothetical protein [unclassified Moraxella]|uniref:hypothetical protein n=1 Tax=unclassified Moraxella TaxID=2685852 RepID=UPI003AF9C3AC
MTQLCPKCFSNHVVPVTTANPNFPQSLEPTLLSPAVLASVGASVCKQTSLPQSVGVILGTIFGLALANFSKPINSRSFYCCKCHQVFEVDNQPLTHQKQDIGYQSQLSQSN